MSNIQNVSWPGWETVRLIGQGSFGTVYEIQRQVFDDTEKAALKVISIPQSKNDIEELYSDGYDEESITSTFQSHLKSIVAEYSLTKKMSSCVNIVNCEDVRYVQHDDGIGWDIFIKMELLTPLTKALPKVIPEETVIKLAKDMCSALVQCKKHEIVHRDIKPQNIFVSENGDYKLGDFGIAKTVEKTTGGTKIGTYKYMAPEVYNNQPYGCGSDIYSLGMVLYWLLNERRMPFLPLPPEKLKAGMEEQARRRRMSGEPLPAPAHGSAALKEAVLKACAFDPQKRYQTPEQMLQAILAIEHDWKCQHPELSGMQICAVCGAALEADCRFCVFCGNRVTTDRQDCGEAEEVLIDEAPAIEEPTAGEPLAEVPTGEVVVLDQWVTVPDKAVDQVQTVLCARCSAVLEPDSRFCTQCGASLEEQTAEEPEEPEEIPADACAEEVQPEVVRAGEVSKAVAACTRCGAVLEQDAHFCTRCGMRLEEMPKAETAAVCAHCGAKLEPDAKFCIMCGTSCLNQ